MTKECRSTNGESLARDFLTVSHFVLRHLLLIRHSIICRSSFVLLLLTPALQAAENLGVLGSKPKWGALEHYQETITKVEFSQLMQNVYCTHGIAPDLIEINTDAARILTNREPQKFFTYGSRRITPRAIRCRVFGIPLDPCHTRKRTNRSQACGLHSTRVIWAANGQEWKNAGFKSATPSRFRKVTWL